MRVPLGFFVFDRADIHVRLISTTEPLMILYSIGILILLYLRVLMLGLKKSRKKRTRVSFYFYIVTKVRFYSDCAVIPRGTLCILPLDSVRTLSYNKGTSEICAARYG